jgi:ribosomal protein L14
MIQVGTFKCDNSGGRKVQCIKYLWLQTKYAGIGAVVLVSVKSLRTKEELLLKLEGDILKL